MVDAVFSKRDNLKFYTEIRQMNLPSFLPLLLSILCKKIHKTLPIENTCIELMLEFIRVEVKSFALFVELLAPKRGLDAAAGEGLDDAAGARGVWDLNLCCCSCC